TDGSSVMPAMACIDYDFSDLQAQRPNQGALAGGGRSGHASNRIKRLFALSGFGVWSNGVKRWRRCRFAGGLIGLFDLLDFLVFSLGALRLSGFARLFQWMLFRRLQ